MVESWLRSPRSIGYPKKGKYRRNTRIRTHFGADLTWQRLGLVVLPLSRNRSRLCGNETIEERVVPWTRSAGPTGWTGCDASGSTCVSLVSGPRTNADGEAFGDLYDEQQPGGCHLCHLCSHGCTRL